MSASCTLVTYSGLPDLDPDDLPLVEALSRLGVDCRVARWDDPDYRWDATEHVLLRTTWDYHLHLLDFMSWLDRIKSVTCVWNPVDLVKWNVNKTYLLRLQKAGVPVVPTRLLSHGLPANLSTLLDETGWDEAIIKPVVGLATHGVKRLSRADLNEGQTALRALLESDDVLLQKFLPSVNDYGERALMFFNGEYSHAVRKTAFQALAHTGGAGETAAEATEAELAVARQALQFLEKPPLYARVDLVPDGAGQPVIMELELVEPSLFFAYKPGSAERFASIFVDVAGMT